MDQGCLLTLHLPLPGNDFVIDDRSAPREWPLLCEPSVCIFIVSHTGSCHLCLWGSSTDTNLSHAPHARTRDLTNSYSDQSYWLPHSGHGVSQEWSAMRLTSWFRSPLPCLLCQVSHVWPRVAIPMLCSELRTCRGSPQTTILSNVQNRTVVIHRRTKTEHFLPQLNTVSQSSMAHQVENNPDNSVYCYIG